MKVKHLWGLKYLWGIFDAENKLVHDEVFVSMFDAIDYCKSTWTYKEWNEYEFTLNRFCVDMTIIAFTEQINPYDQ